MRTSPLFIALLLTGCASTPASRPSPVQTVETSEVPVDVGPAEIEDYVDTQTESPPSATREPHPLADYTDQELEEMLLGSPGTIGSASIGRASAGSLFNAVPMPEGEQWVVVNPSETWGTPETIAYLTHTIQRVNEMFPDTRPLPIGDISAPSGGHLTPHVSHQSGRDVDLGYYYTTDDKWYTTASDKNLDLARTWAFVRTTVTETDVQAIFIDRSIQRLLREYASSLGEDEGWLDQLFGGPSTTLRPLILHEDGHASHIHVRYYNPVAEETGRRIYATLLKHKKLQPPTYYVQYKVQKGDSLIRIARKFNTTVDALKKANRLRNSRIVANRVYKIPRRGGVAFVDTPILVPARRLPPTSDAVSSTSGARTGNSAPSATIR